MATVASPASAVEFAPARERLRAVTEDLARMDRRASTPGERVSALWVAERLREAGAEDVRLEPYRSHTTWAAGHLPHYLAGLLAARLGGRAGASLAAAIAVSYELDAGARLQWVRRLIPAGTSHNVTARLPARGPRRGTLVIEAHHDAAHGGWVWHPRALEAGRRRAVRTGKIPAFHTPALAALGAVATGRRPLRAAGAAVLAAMSALAVQAARSQTSPAANDNATGVAVLLELARHLRANPLDGVDVVLAVPGSEEAGSVGIRAWLDAHRHELDPRSTLVLVFDTLGSGTPVVLEREGLTGSYRARDVALADAGARVAGLPRPQRFGLGAPCDGSVVRQAGLPVVALSSHLEGALARIHTPLDTPERVDWDCVVHSARLAEGTARAWAETL